MNSLIVIFFMGLAAANAGLLAGALVGPSAPGLVIQGPSNKASYSGPDGSHISAYIPGGRVVVSPKHGGVVKAAVAPGYVAPGLGLAYGVLPGSGLEGQYVPDYSENLYDDGSYRGDHGLYY